MDCNNFFVSCERLFRPDLKGKPVAVLSSNDGCIVARSQEVKDLGIPMGAPLFQVKDLVTKHRITLFSSNFSLYRDISRRVMHALKEEFDQVSVYSIDEAFVSIPHTMSISDIVSVRERIITKTGIPVSIGIAPTKTIAKLANSEAKRGDGVTWFDLTDAQARYKTTPCGSIWGIGRAYSKSLDVLGIKTVADMLDTGRSFMRSEFGIQGERLFLELSGISVDGLAHADVPQGSIASTRSFRAAIHDISILQAAIGYHVTHVGEKLRKHGLVATSMVIICAPSRHSSFVLRQGSASCTLERPTNDTHTLLTHARTLLEGMYDPEVPYKKAGIIVSGLTPEAYVAAGLFDDTERKQSRSDLHTIIDGLNARFGQGTVRPGVVHHDSVWAPSAELRSPHYTTQWDEIARVKAI